MVVEKSKETKDFESKKAVERFLNNFSAKNTKSLYSIRLRKFFKCIGKDPDNYIKGNEDYENDVKKFAQSITHLAPISQKCHINTIKKFLDEYDIELKKKIWHNINNRIKGNKPISEEKVPEIEDLQKILQHTDVRGKAYFLTLLSSGIRDKCEALEIRWGDIDFETRQINIRPEVSKNGNRRISFISDEAKEALLYYKEKYSDYVNRAISRGFTGKDIEPKDDALIFPFSYDVGYEMWHNCLKKSGYYQKDSRTGRCLYRLYTLRKFFKTQLSDARVPQPLIENFMGHDGYLDSTYYKTNRAKELYDSSMQSLTIFSDYEKALKQIEPKIQKQDSAISHLAQENQNLKQKLVTMEKALQAITAGMGEDLQEKIEAKEQLFHEKIGAPSTL